MFAYNVFLCIAVPGSGSGLRSGLKTKDNSPPLGDCGPSEGTSSPPPQGFCLQNGNTKYDYLFMTKIHVMDIIHLSFVIIIKPTFTSLLLCGLATAVAQARHRFDVTLADRWGVKHQLGRAGEADRKACCAHQDACDAWKQPAEGGCETTCLRFSHYLMSFFIQGIIY